MRVRNKNTGEIIEIPDGTPKERFSEYFKNAQPSEQAPKDNSVAAAIKENPASRFLIGAGKTIAETGPVPLARVLSKMGVPGANKVVEGYEKSNDGVDLGDAGRYGGMAGDMLANATATAATGGAGLVVPALQMAAGHQLQNYARTGEVSAGEAAVDAGTGIALGGIGNKLGPLLKKFGIGAARRGLDVSKKALGGANPIDIEYGLKNRLIPLWGGANKMADNLAKKSGDVDANLVAMLEAKGVNLNHPLVMKNTDAVVSRLEKGSKLNAGTSEAMEAARNQALENASQRATVFKEVPTGKFKPDQTSTLVDEYGLHSVTPGEEIMDNVPEIIPGAAARDIRKLADKNAKYDAVANPIPPPAATFNRIYRNQVENDLSKKMAGTDLAADYSLGKQELKKITPLLDAAENSSKNNHFLRNSIDIGLASAGAGSALFHPLAAVPEVAAILGRRLSTTPGGGRLLYEAGRAADAGATRKAGRYGLDLARSAYFGPGGGNR